MYLSVLIPFYNEDDLIEQNILKIINYLTSKFEFEILIINDSGKTNPVLEKLNNKFECISLYNNKKNFGKGYSIRKGVTMLKGEIVLISDADLATPIEELEKLYKNHKSKNDIVIGSRSCVDSEILTKQPFYRITAGKVYNFLTKFILGFNFNDTQCGLKLFNGKKIKYISTLCKINRFCIDAEILFLAKKFKYNVFEKGIIWINDKYFIITDNRFIFYIVNYFSYIINSSIRSSINLHHIKITVGSC